MSWAMTFFDWLPFSYECLPRWQPINSLHSVCSNLNAGKCGNSLFVLLGLLLPMGNGSSADTIEATEHNSDDDLMPGFNCEQGSDSKCADLFPGYDDVCNGDKAISSNNYVTDCIKAVDLTEDQCPASGCEVHDVDDQIQVPCSVVSKREPRNRTYLQERECNAEAVHFFLRTVCPCGKNCSNRLRANLEDPFTTVLELRQERFEMTQKEEKHWWFAKLLRCKVMDDNSRITFEFKFNGTHMCRFAFYELHGFRGARGKRSSRSRHFEQLIRENQTHVPDRIMQHSKNSLKQAVTHRWIWRHIKLMGQPKPNSDGPSGTMYLMHKDLTERHALYTKDLTCDGKKSKGAVYWLGYDAFRIIWLSDWKNGWVDEGQHHFKLKINTIADRAGMRICRYCSQFFERLVKAKTVADRQLVRAQIARHKKFNEEAREAYAQNIYEGISNGWCMSVAIDAMDQAKSRIPVTATHSAGGIMHKIQLKLTGVLIHGDEKPWSIYVTFPWTRTGANITCTIFADMFAKGKFDNKRDVMIQVDGASDNICKTNVYFFCAVLLIAQEQKQALRSITNSRMLSGHTKFDVDQHWSKTSGYMHGNKKNGYQRRDVFTMSEFEGACRAAHKNLAEYVVLHNTLNWDAWISSMLATDDIHKNITQAYVIELTTDSSKPGVVYIRMKHRMGASVPFSRREQFFPRPSLPQDPQKLPSPLKTAQPADLKQWDLSQKSRAVLSKQIGAKAAKQQLPPRMVTWIDRNQKVMKEMAKFANGGYAEHIVTDAQKVETLQTLQ